MAGSRRSSRQSRSNSSRPLMPGMRTSNRRHPGRVESKVSRNCFADSYASARKCIDRTNTVSACRTAGSSSMMKTVGSASTAMLSKVDGQGEMEGAAPVRIGRDPQRSSLVGDNRAADRQSHSHPAGLGGEETVEDAVDQLGRNADAAVAHVDPDVLPVVDGRADGEPAELGEGTRASPRRRCASG